MDDGKSYNHCVYKIYHSGMDPEEQKWPENDGELFFMMFCDDI